MKQQQQSVIAAVFGIILSLALVSSVSAKDQESKPVSQGKNAKQTGEASKADPLRDQVDEAIKITSKRILTANVHTPWQILHGILALRHDFQVKKGDKKVSAIEWLSNDATFGGQPVFQITKYGAQGHPYTRDYVFEGHPNQFLAILTMSNLPLDFEMTTGAKKITIADVVKNSKMDINSREEITWSLWALSHYLPSNSRWHNKYGESWSIERLVQIQTQQKVTEGACGGTHGLFALAYARNKHIESGRPLRGVWYEAHRKVKRYVETARWSQNYDGSFSASFFEGRRFARDFATRIETSGHILEFLVMAVPHDRLSEDWMRRGVAAVSRELIENRKRSAKCGPLYHALHGLVLYRDRMYPPEQLAKREPIKTAKKPQETKPTAKATSEKSESTTKTSPTKPATKADSKPAAKTTEVTETSDGKKTEQTDAKASASKSAAKSPSKATPKSRTAKMKVRVSNAKTDSAAKIKATPANLKTDGTEKKFEKPVIKSDKPKAS